MEKEFLRLGGVLIAERVDCDIDFEELSDPWIERIVGYEKTLRSDA